MALRKAGRAGVCSLRGGALALSRSDTCRHG
jgi:hypothetical protein